MNSTTKASWFSWFYAIFLNQIAKNGFYSALCTGIFSRFDFSFPCNFFICKSRGTTNIPLDQENCGACSLLYILMAASTRSKKTVENLPFSSKMADICLQVKCREQRDYPPWLPKIMYHLVCAFKGTMFDWKRMKTTICKQHLNVSYYYTINTQNNLFKRNHKVV